MDSDRAQAIRQIAKKFHYDWGIDTKVETPENIPDNFPIAAQSGQGPDIVIFAHDKVGEWADSGLIMPIDISPSFRKAFFDQSWKATKHRKQIWGYPLSFEVVSLVYNKKLVTEPPPTQLDQLVSWNKQFKKQYPNKMGILWDYTTPFLSWGILASGGAYIYAKDAENYDLNQIGINSSGAVKALTQLSDLVKQGVLPRGGLSTMDPKALMADGKLAMMITGPWDWDDLIKNGIDFGVTPIPGINGHPGKPFIGVTVAYLNRSSPNLDLAQEFLEHYLITANGLLAMNQSKPIGIPALISLFDEMSKTNPLLQDMKHCADEGEVMPNIPEMGKFWSAIGPALQLATRNQCSAQAALDDAKRHMR
jgi:maltose/maltodextrin transport system substrate-binding protein